MWPKSPNGSKVETLAIRNHGEKRALATSGGIEAAILFIRVRTRCVIVPARVQRLECWTRTARRFVNNGGGGDPRLLLPTARSVEEGLGYLAVARHSDRAVTLQRFTK